MALEKNDLDQIEKIVKKTVDNSIEKSERRIISIIGREITDLAEINRAVIKKVDRIDNHEKRIVRIERKIGLAD